MRCRRTHHGTTACHSRQDCSSGKPLHPPSNGWEPSLRHFLAGMWGTLALAAVSTTVVALLRPLALWSASPFLAVWFLSPVVAFWVSRPKQIRDLSLSEHERQAFRRITCARPGISSRPLSAMMTTGCRRTTIRKSPTAVSRIAHHRPTRACCSYRRWPAHDLGYLSLGGLAERLEKTFDTLEQLEKHWGHLYNWYETRTLRPLPPAYISTVDSGNLLGCLLTLKQGLIEKIREPVLGPAVADGLLDTFLLIDEPARKNATRLEQILREEPSDLLAWNDWLGRLEREAEALLGRVNEAAGRQDDGIDESQSWAQALLAMIRGRRRRTCRAGSLAAATWRAIKPAPSTSPVRQR